MRLAVDATPLLGQRSGVGRYLWSLLNAVGVRPDAPDVVLTLFSVRGRVDPLPRGSRPAPGRFPARLLRPLWALTSLPPVELLSGRHDVFHAGNFVLPPTARSAGVVTVHDLAFLHHADTVDATVSAYRHLVPRSLRRADAVVTVSAAVRDEICAEYPVDPGVVYVAHNGVDPAWGRAVPADDALRSRLGLPREYLLFVGNVEPRKNLRTLVAAHLQARRQDLTTPPLVLVGPAGWGEVWDGTSPSREQVLPLGYLSEADLPRVVAGARTLCMPSLYEGFGLPVLEALAAGTAVIASDIGAHRETAAGHARLLPTYDVDAWSHALVAPVPRSANTVAAARAHALSFTWEGSADTHLRVWREALASQRRHRMPR